MTLPDIFILILYGILGVLFFAVLFYVKLQGRELLGRPAMNIYIQMVGKFSIFIPAILLLAAALGKNVAWLEVPEWLQWVAVFICFEGILFLNGSLLQMGKYTKVGLPRKDEIRLQTKGVYHLSRNPMYFGLFLVALASLIYVPNPVNLITALLGIAVHHRIIINEEKYLEIKFGKQWHEYAGKVRRYF